jgi:diacylglycerol kinase (ATP)
VRILLVHNPGAGTADHDAADLSELLVRAGHHVDYHSTRDGFLTDALRRPADMVVAAGGDGTIGKVIKRLPDRRVPVAPMPLGTANNIATALGIRQTPKDVAEALRQATFHVLTVGRVRSLGRPVRFLESVGFGAIARAMQEADKGKRDGAKNSVEDSRKMLRGHLESAKAERYVLRWGGHSSRIKAIFLEIMNLGSFGPSLQLSNMHPGAQRLDVVWVDPADRGALLRWLDSGAPNHEAPVRRVRCPKVKVWTEGGLARVDDTFVPLGRRIQAVSIKLEREPVRIAAPREAVRP